MVSYSSPVQLPGTTWSKLPIGNTDAGRDVFFGAIKTDGTLWTWGANPYGALGQNQQHSSHNSGKSSSPAQVGSDTTWANVHFSNGGGIATKTDGTLWSWGYQSTTGALGDNTIINRSSPVQVPGTSWDTGEGKISVGQRSRYAIRTDGTLWAWGNKHEGQLGLNDAIARSSPTQIPGTTWKTVLGNAGYWTMGGKTDGTLWTWGGGVGDSGRSGTNAPGANSVSSPIQVLGSDWVTDGRGYFASRSAVVAKKTDGTLWSWGSNNAGNLGIPSIAGPSDISSPTQIGTDTNWDKVSGGPYHIMATKTDGSLWVWGNNDSGNDGAGALGQNNLIEYSSPIQIGSRKVWTSGQIGGTNINSFAILEDTSS